MAKTTLKDSVNDDEIIDIGEVDVPNIILEEKHDSGYGIKGLYGDYSLVEKKIAYRSVKEEDNVDKKYKVIKYATWSDIPCYQSTLLGCVNAWIDKRNLTKFKALKKADFSEVEKIYNETKLVVKDVMDKIELNELDKKAAIQKDTLNALIEETNKVKSILREADILEELIKEKKRIIMKTTEPKKHRTPKDSDEGVQRTRII